MNGLMFYLSVVLYEGKHLGENYQRKLAIPAAGYVEGGGKEKARHDGGPTYIRLQKIIHCFNCLNPCGREYSSVAISQELHREFV
jgi:hypothetical protein